MAKMNSSFFHHKLLFHVAIVSIPFLSFLNTNVHELDFVVIRTILFIFLTTILFTISFAKLLSIVFKKLNFSFFHIILSVTFFLLFFLYIFLKDLIHIVDPIYSGNISFILIIIIFIIFYLFFFRLKNILIFRFILIYLSLCFLFNLGAFLINVSIIFSQSAPTLGGVLFNEEQIKKINQNNNKNIYYTIIDKAIPLEKFDEVYQTNYYSKYNNDFGDLGYFFIQNTKSSYQYTQYTFASILYLSYYINNNNYKFVPTSNVYPIILSKNKAPSGPVEGLPLIKTLNKIGYEFKWIGPAGENCELYNPDLCLDATKNTKTNSKINSLISYYVAFTLLDRSPVIPIYSRVNNFFFPSEHKKVSIEYRYRKNDTIGRFLKTIQVYDYKNKNHLFFIHHLLPHTPYIYNSDCSFNKSKDPQWQGYKKNYECTLKRVKELIDYINQNDPNAIVIIQSDHGVLPNDELIKFKGRDFKATFSRYDIFNLIKINKECKKYLSNTIDQPNAMRLALYCATGQKVKLLEKKSYFVDFEVGHTLGGGRFSLKEIKTFEDELTTKERGKK